MKKIIVVLITSLSFLLLNCSDDDPTNSTDIKKYPANLGNEWEYTTTFTLIFYDSSGNIYGDDTLFIGNTIANVIDDNDTLTNNNNLVLFSSYDVDTPQNINYIWYINDDAGLTAVAYSGPGSSQPILPKSITAAKNIFIENLLKNSLMPVIHFNINSSLEDSIQYYDPLRKVLKYPLMVGRTWTESTSPFTIKRTITNKKAIETQAGNFTCYIIKTEIEEFPNVSYEDFISLDAGLVLRRTNVDSLVHLNEQGDTLGFFNTTSISELIRLE